VRRGDAQRGRKAHASGRWAERLCVLSLLLRGYAILGRGVVTGRGTGAGEIDIIARRGKVLAFIEVKKRGDFAAAAQALSAVQQQRLIRGAEVFLARHPALAALEPRFDLMLAVPGRWPRHMKDAWRIGG